MGKQDIDVAEQDSGERFHWRRAGHLLRMELDKGEVTWDEGRKLFECNRSTGTALNPASERCLPTDTHRSSVWNICVIERFFYGTQIHGYMVINEE